VIALGRPVRVVVPLAVAVAACPRVPSGLPRDLTFQVIGLVAAAAALRGLARQGATRRAGWLLVALGYLGWVLAHSVRTLEVRVLDLDAQPGPADAVRVASYAVMAAGLLLMVRRRGGRRDHAAFLDAAVLGAGLAVAAGVLLVAPVARDSASLGVTLADGGQVLADVLLLAVLARLWTATGQKTAAFGVLSAALLLTVLADVLSEYRSVVDADFGAAVVEQVLWLAACVLVAGAAWMAPGEEPAEPAPGQAELIHPGRRLLLLFAGLALPVATLVADGLLAERFEWRVVAGGSALVSLLVLIRLAGLLTSGQSRVVELATLSRSDALTGLANRRTWDFELARAARSAKERNAPLTVALLDLDGLHRYNRAHGHPAGDRLLRAAARAWSEQLRPGQVLARYAGGGFALLCPDQWAADVRPVVDAMRAATPDRQTVSVGIATWDPHSEPDSVMTAATQFVTEAKRSGGDQVQVAPRPTSKKLIPRPLIHWQPIVDLRTTRPVGVEALSRFQGGDPLSVFEAAASVGSGPTLEATAITYALTNRPEGLWVAVNVSLAGLASVQVQRALAGNLAGVVLEVTEHGDADVPDLAELVADHRARGASIAVDDSGPGLSNLDRLLTLRPDIVKLDLSRATSLDSDYARASIRMVTGWAAAVGAKVCAEGVETEDQWRRLRDAGIKLGQGHFFGRPMPPEELLALPRDTVAARVASPVAPRGVR
jgi:diguanylate cyclase (GGDEF)-like protein